MPPRKKADPDAAPAVPTRQSSRIKAAAAAAPPPAPAPPAKKAPAKKAAAKPKPAGPGAIAAGGGLAAAAEPEPQPKKADAPPEEPESYTATGLDNALDLLEVVTAKMDKASVGSQAAGLERHPEVRTWVDGAGFVLIAWFVASLQGIGLRSWSISGY